MSTVTDQDLAALKYPTGRFVRGTKATSSQRREECIALLEAFPAELHRALAGMGEDRLDTPYRSGGWTVRQLGHHLADSHGQSLHRFKLALTEDTPVIKPYKEDLWAEHADARKLPLEPSLSIITGTHARWVVLLRALSATDFERAFFHPEQKREITLAEALELYVWHGRHHLAHIIGLRERMGW
ncbi:MAG: putative metal-dependent hydrolase [Flavobacteriales bacterium]|nr:putative metal-dependent hydrolase [Flavobacteriales bacterium]